jgi:hypothetical protein
MIHGQREKTAIAQSPAQHGGIGRNHLAYPFHIAQCNRRRDSDLRSAIEEQSRYSGKPLRIIVALCSVDSIGRLKRPPGFHRMGVVA